MNANITLAQEWIAQADAILIGASNDLLDTVNTYAASNNK